MSRSAMMALCLALTSLGGPAHAQALQVTVGQPTIVFSTSSDGCTASDVPDGSPRAFRRANGEIALIATQSINRLSVGSAFDALHRDCHVVFDAPHDPEPSHFNDYGWLMAPYTTDGHFVYSLVDEEYHGAEHPGKCYSKSFQKCWENAITAVISSDGGENFRRLTGRAGIVAAFPTKYSPGSNVQFGYFGPTNILEHKGHIYFLFAALSSTARRESTCLAEAEAGTKIPDWHFWDGKGFSYTVPYGPLESSRFDPTRPCVDLPTSNLFFGLGSLSWLSKASEFVVIMRSQRWDQAKYGVVAGVYASTSRDLLHWSVPVPVLTDATAGAPEFFPSLIDPRSEDRDFGTIDGPGLLLTTEMPAAGGNGGRRLVRRLVTLRQGATTPKLGIDAVKESGK